MPEGKMTSWYLTILAFCGFVSVTTEFSVVGLVPALAKGMKIPFAQAGNLMGWFAISAALAGPFVTQLFSQGNRWTLVTRGTLIFVAGNFLIALYASYTVAVVVRIIQGCLLPAIIANVMVSAEQLVPSDKSAWAISRANMGVAIATVIGIPLLNFLSDTFNWRLAFTFIAGMGFLAAVLLMSFTPQRHVIHNRTKENFYCLIQNYFFLVHLLTTTLIFTGMFTGYTYLLPILDKSFAGKDTTLLLLYFGVSGLLGSWVVGYVSKHQLLLTAIVLSISLAVAMGLMTAANHVTVVSLYLVVIVWGAVHTTLFTVTLSRSLEVGRESPESAVAFNLSACNVGIAAGSWLGGYTVNYLGVEKLPVIGTAVVLLGVLLMLNGQKFHDRKGLQM
ncbi:MFS transporter [Pleionea mediterranea]|nr:MFS transporter [Pleionea mediterranea]